MKNARIFLLIAALFSMTALSAQSFKKGDIMLSPGIGLGTYGVGFGIGFAVPVMLNFDIGVHDYVSVGAYAGFWTRKYNSFFSDTRYTSTHVGVRASFHWWQLLDQKISADLKGDKLDVYLTAWVDTTSVLLPIQQSLVIEVKVVAKWVLDTSLLLVLVSLENSVEHLLLTVM